MLEEVYEEVIDFLREHYPDTPIVFRADSGFIRESLVRGIVEKGAYYLFGYAPNRAIQKFADTEWAPEIIKQYARPGDGMLVLRALGEYEEYRPKTCAASSPTFPLRMTVNAVSFGVPPLPPSTKISTAVAALPVS